MRHCHSVSKRFTIVTTTINVPVLLEAYVSDAKEHGRLLDQVVVAGDRRTPLGTAEFCRALEAREGVPVRYLGPAEQERYLAPWPELASFIPWNSISRRIVALLVAHEGGSDVLVTLDDDNFLAEPDYLGHHAHLGEVVEVEGRRSRSGWWNVCELLNEEHGIPFYARGHPLSDRWTDAGRDVAVETVRGRAAVNAGLWLSEPDIDAITRLAFPIRVTGTAPGFRPRIACAPGTWAPFNSQNTAIVRDALPAYLLFPHVGRFDDIWGSFVLRHAVDHLGGIVTYGSPLVRQDRNPHDLFRDFDDERLGLRETDVFLAALRACDAGPARTYGEAFAAIAAQFPAALAEACGAAGRDVSAFARVVEGLRLWADVFARR